MTRVRTTSDADFRHAAFAGAAVCLDVFDTALFRCVPQPADLLEIAALRLREAGALAIEPAEFRSLRAAAEREARRAARKSGRGDATLGEIYAIAGRECRDLDPIRAMAEETSVERAAYVANSDVKRLYDLLQAESRRVVFVCDSYLSQDVVGEILRTSGYGGDHELFVSNAWHATLDDGTLLPLVASRFGLDPATMVYLGDGRRADLRLALRAGVQAYTYAPQIPTRNSYRRPIADKVLDRLAALATLGPPRTAEDRMLHELGYGVVAPIFLGFTQWLIERLRSQPAELVLFCARDGYFIHQAFTRLGEFVELPRSLYFEVSRRALVFPSISKLDERAVDFLCANNAPLQLSQFFSRIGIDVSAYPHELQKCGLRPDSRIYDRDSRRRVRETVRGVIGARARAGARGARADVGISSSMRRRRRA